MLEKKKKILVHVDNNGMNIYTLENDKLLLIEKRQLNFGECCEQETCLKRIDICLEYLKSLFGEVDNESIRLYATGIFQDFTSEEKDRLVIHVFVNCGLYLNIISHDLEQFYLEKSRERVKKDSLMEGLICQEFRRVVVCGSFQQHLNEIGEVMSLLQKHNVEVLSPWTTKVVPETLGTDFILLEGQELKNERDAWRHKYDHMNKFRMSDAIIICNPDGIVGQGTMFEFGFMVACSKRIIFIQKPINVSIPFPYEVGFNFI